MDALTGLNNVNVSNKVVLLDADEDSLTIGMDVVLQNPSTTTVLAEKGLLLELMASTSDLVCMVYG